MAVLSIEESSKSLIYHDAAEGVLRVVQKNPNHLTTFQEKELLDHRFKHALLANLLADWLRYAPFYEVVEGLRKPRLTRNQVRELVLGAVHAHRILQVDLASGGKSARDVQTLFGLLERLNDLKNRGFYVDHVGGRILKPNDLPARELERLLELADGALEAATELSRRHYTEHEKRLQILANTELLRRIRRARRRVAAEHAPTKAATNRR